ncbi:MAG: hypothetical protein LBF56_02160, partial [Holosporales bacterium]|nr:hypothetical protein [Holosporales bacterium]
FTIYNNSYSISIPNSIPIQTIDGTYYVACGYDGLSHRTYYFNLTSLNLSDYDSSRWQTKSDFETAIGGLVTWPS